MVAAQVAKDTFEAGPKTGQHLGQQAEPATGRQPDTTRLEEEAPVMNRRSKNHNTSQNRASVGSEVVPVKLSRLIRRGILFKLSAPQSVTIWVTIAIIITALHAGNGILLSYTTPILATALPTRIPNAERPIIEWIPSLSTKPGPASALVFWIGEMPGGERDRRCAPAATLSALDVASAGGQICIWTRVG